MTQDPKKKRDRCYIIFLERCGHVSYDVDIKMSPSYVVIQLFCTNEVVKQHNLLILQRLKSENFCDGTYRNIDL